MQLSEKTKNKLKGVMPVTKEEREDALASACMQVKRVLPEFTTKFQNAYSENGFYRPIDNVEWTTGFWTGEIWLAYEYGGEDVLLKAAEIQMQDFLHRIEQKICVDHHDMGFLYTPSCVAGYKLTGSGTGKRAALLAADQLKSRFQEKGAFIQAWGIYGTALAYRYTKREEYKYIFRGVSKYYIEHLPKDLVPYWDLEFSDGDAQPRDSSSASIAACGMLEMAKYLYDEEAAFYRDLAEKFIGSVYRNYAVKDFEKSNGIVLHSTYSNRSPYNTCNPCGVDECNSWGDYFYMEALTRLQKDWQIYW